MSPTQITFVNKFKNPLYKLGELVFAYDVQANNKTPKPRAFYALYVGSNDRGINHSVFKLSTKKMIIAPRCKPILMSDNIIKVVNQTRKDEGMPNGIVFHNILKESTLDDMY